jgi:hypothetical protein
VSPLLLTSILTRRWFIANTAFRRLFAVMFDKDFDLPFLDGELYVGDIPRSFNAKYFGVKFFITHVGILALKCSI